MRIGAAVPVLRSFDEAKARAFWIDYLAFEEVWQHRFAPDMPLYMEVRRGDCVLHLSEHHGDATPGARIRVPVEDIDAFHAEITGRDYPFARPGIEEQPYGTREVKITDPFGNTVIFWSEA